MSIPLEDHFNDVLGKACRGLGLTTERLAVAAGVDAARVAAAMDGEASDETLLLLAVPLGLHGPSLVALARSAWRPGPLVVEGLACFTTRFDDMTVNAYLVWDPSTGLAAAFDTGADASPMLAFLADRGLQLDAVFITHTHSDHVADIATLRRAAPPQRVFSHLREPLPGTETFTITPDAGWTIGRLRVSPRATHGHAKGGVTYLIHGLARPVAVVGDAIFAGSMGGGAISYADALRTNRAEIFTLPDDAVLCPGHGPLSSVGEEKSHNPFFPEFK